MSIQRKVTVAPEGKAGFVVEGLPHTYDEATAKRLQYMKTDGSDEFDFPEDGVHAEVAPDKLKPPAKMSKADKKSAAESDKKSAAESDENHY